MSHFVYATCSIGSEKLLKADVAQRHPGLRPAFMRPGFITFKSDAPAAGVQSPFAHSSGQSLGHDEAAIAAVPRPFGLMVYGPEASPETLAEARPDAAERHRSTPLPQLPAGAPVVDVVLLGDRRFFGLHPYDPADRLHPGVYTPDLPAEAPSRAWLKIEEALRLTGVVPVAGQRALELGSAPGGAAYALLSRGLEVTGVDPAQMDPRVLSHPRYRHLDRSINLLPPEELPVADWILSDMNVAPEQTLHHVLALVDRRRPLGVFITLKLKDERAARHLWADANDLSARGFVEVGLRQLPSHRQEILLFGLSPLGAAGKRLQG